MRGALSLATALMVAAARGTASPRACASSPLCLCRDDHFACDRVPFYTFPQTDVAVSHVTVSAARLGALGEAALAARALRTLVMVASRLHHLDAAAFSCMKSTLASLDLGYNEFTEIPIDALKHLTVLNWLNLQNNYISDLESVLEWGGLSDSLSSLSLSNNHIGSVSAGALAGLRRLAHLELGGNRLRVLDAAALPASLAALRLADNLLPRVPCAALASLPRLTHLRLRNNLLFTARDHTCPRLPYTPHTLDLAHNHLTDDFHFHFDKTFQLKHLILDLNNFSTIPSLALQFGHLEKLSMSYNNVSVLSESTVHILKRSLERLELDHNKLTNIPPSVLGMERLRYLSLSYNSLQDVEYLPQNLRTLLLAGNYLSEFPSGLQNLSSATIIYLDLGYTGISSLSAAHFGAWARTLRTLVLRGARLTRLDAGAFPTLPLRDLQLSFNNLYHVDDNVFANLTDLKVLEMSSTVIGENMSIGSRLVTLKWLKLDNNNIHRFSSTDLENFPSLEYLNLDFNRIIEFPSEVSKVNGSYTLRELRLSYNYMIGVNSEFFEKLDNLQSVDLSYNRIQNVKKASFANLPKLVYLSLAANGAKSISQGAFRALPLLEVLDLSDNRLVEFSTRYFVNVSRELSALIVNASHNRIHCLTGAETGALAKSTFIRILDLSHNSLENISRHFVYSLGPHIKEIYLAYNKLTHLDSSIFTLVNLNILSLNNNNISAVRRRSFSDVSSLQILDLSHNNISQLSVEQFYNLRQLRHLKLNNNELRALPRDVFKNTQLEYVDLSENRLALYPLSALCQAGLTLRRAEMAGNRLEYVDAAMLQATGFLHELSLARNALTVLSDNTFAGVPQLRRLDVSYNALKTNFRELFHNTPRLRHLSLAGASLETLPHLPLNYLTELNLRDNHIASYSESDVRQLRNLRALDLTANKFTCLRPAMWAGLPRLMSLDVSMNPLVRIPLGAFEGLHHLTNLRLRGLRFLETVEPKALRPLLSLRSLALETPVGPGRGLPIADMVSAIPQLEVLNVLIRETSLEQQLADLSMPKLRSLEVCGSAVLRVSPRALQGVWGSGALAVRLSGTAVSALPAGLATPLAQVPHLALDFSDNQLYAFTPDVLYPNLTGWNRYTTKLLTGGLSLSGNPLRCDCSGWLGGWLRRWTSEVGGEPARAARAARRGWCVSRGGQRAPLVALRGDGAHCGASALAGRALSLLTTALLSLR